MEDGSASVKKRGRPSKVHADPAAEDSRDSSPGENMPTIPKKRGRPAKVKKTPSKGDIPEDDELLEVNGEAPKSAGRGRPRKIVSLQESSGNDDDDDNDDDNDDGGSSYEDNAKSPKQKSPSSAKRRKLGRPRKIQTSDQEEDEDYEEEHRPVGRPATGAVNLNIVRTGRGPGRPKKAKKAAAAAAGENGDEAPRKRGRPPTNGTKAAYSYVPTGRPRGRPKAVASADDGCAPMPAMSYVPTGRPRGRPKVVVSAHGAEQSKAADEESGNEEESADGDEAVPVTTPKKRGRPAMGGSASKPRGRPPKVSKVDESASSEDDSFDTTTDNEAKEPKSNVTAERINSPDNGDEGAENESTELVANW
ncbi:D1 [Drosophila busckii]|uniref:D1 n=1 Tax=Drosophila busckii TaxID=30019 RepID=A0A0M5IZD3_DROBS|nr:chromosomal protein D1 [Drosophila busckii]XP_017846551.1 chromosomal protein D1 [Drosophila busckii]ALC45424.1 D1 [Drosophila busckii]